MRHELTQRCWYCNVPAKTKDHIWPRSRGGDDHLNNVVVACTNCNYRKAAKSLFDDMCRCGRLTTPSDLDTSAQCAHYACRCGVAWSTSYDLKLWARSVMRGAECIVD